MKPGDVLVNRNYQGEEGHKLVISGNRHKFSFPPADLICQVRYNALEIGEESEEGEWGCHQIFLSVLETPVSCGLVANLEVFCL